MKTLNNYINEWKLNDQSAKNVDKKNQYFVYKINERKQIKIFCSNWNQFYDYEDKIYDEHGNYVLIDEYGFTCKHYDPGEYKFEIEDINNVKDCFSMFNGCNDLTEVPLFDTSKVNFMRIMFWECDNLTEVPPFDTRNVKDMAGMFNGCKNLEKVPPFNTSNVETMHAMFRGCNNLTEVPLFNIRNVKSMHAMFDGCTYLNVKTKNQWSKIYDFHTHRKK